MIGEWCKRSKYPTKALANCHRYKAFSTNNWIAPNLTNNLVFIKEMRLKWSEKVILSVCECNQNSCSDSLEGTLLQWFARKIQIYPPNHRDFEAEMSKCSKSECVLHQIWLRHSCECNDWRRIHQKVHFLCTKNLQPTPPTLNKLKICCSLYLQFIHNCLWLINERWFSEMK